MPHDFIEWFAVCMLLGSLVGLCMQVPWVRQSTENIAKKTKRSLFWMRYRYLRRKYRNQGRPRHIRWGYNDSGQVVGTHMIGPKKGITTAPVIVTNPRIAYYNRR